MYYVSRVDSSYYSGLYNPFDSATCIDGLMNVEFFAMIKYMYLIILLPSPYLVKYFVHNLKQVDTIIVKLYILQFSLTCCVTLFFLIILYFLVCTTVQ